MFRSVSVIFALLVLAACNTTASVSSFVDRPSLPSAGFSHLVVFAANFPLGERQKVESAIVSAFAEVGVRATAGTEVLPPTRQFSEKEISTRLAGSGADGLLIVYEVGRETVASYVPPTVISPGVSSTVGNVRGYGSFYSFGATTTYKPPTVMGGYNVYLPTAAYGAALYRLGESWLQVWKAEIMAHGNAAATYDEMAEHAGKAAYEQLQKDGVTFVATQPPSKAKR